MSTYVSTWVWKHSRCGVHGLLVMIALADMATDEGECWPSVRTLSQRCRCDERTVKNNIRLAQDLGEIEIVPRFRPNGSKTSNLYRFTKYVQGEGGIIPTYGNEPGGNEGFLQGARNVPTQGAMNAPSQGTTKAPSRGQPMPPPDTSNDSLKESSFKIGKGISFFPIPPVQKTVPVPVTEELLPVESESQQSKPVNSKPKPADKLEPFRVRVGSWFRRRPTTQWSQKELKALREGLPSLEDEIDVLESLYQDKTQKYNRHDVLTLLNNLPGEIDRARAFAATQEKRKAGKKLNGFSPPEGCCA